MPAKTTKQKRTTRGRRSPAIEQMDQAAAALVEKRALQLRIRTQKEIIALGKKLERMTRTADYKLADLGARLLDRARRAQRHDAAGDLTRETSVADRQPQSVE
jgi:hypothetical protein